LKPAYDTPTQTSDKIINITSKLKYFEVCITIGDHAIEHHELDISYIDSDGRLFEQIWDKYKASRGFGVRRLFLRPKDIHFVMVSISRPYHDI
jgi:hypothetical protein